MEKTISKNSNQDQTKIEENYTKLIKTDEIHGRTENKIRFKRVNVMLY